MQTLKIDRSRYTLSPTRDAGAFAEKLRKCTGKTKPSTIKEQRRGYPKFTVDMSTADYVRAYWTLNSYSGADRFFEPLNTEPATLYSGEDTHETVDDFELCAPVESIQTAPDDIAQPEPAAVETAPDAPIEQPAPVEAWPPLQPMMRPAEHIARLPLFARLAIERIDADSDLRTGAKLDELLRAYAAQYRETCDDYTRQSAHAIASRRFWNFRPDDAPIEPAAIVPAADPAPVCEPVESPALQATRAHQWMTHAARRVYWVHCETARFSRELGPLPFGSMFRRPRSPGFMPDFLAPEIRAHRAAVAAAVRADRAAKRAPADTPRADPAPVDTGAAADAEPIESAPTPGYAFPADALPATHSDDAPALEFVSRWTGARCNGLSEVTARIECARRKKAEPGFVFKVAPCLGDGLAPWQVTAMRGKFEVQRWRAVDPVPGDSDPVPVNSPAPVDPDEQQTGETVETWFERIRRESAEKRARIAELADTVAAGSGSIGFTHPSDPARYGIAGPDMSGRGAYRFSYFDAAGPIGDAIRSTLADAIAAGIEYGFTVDAAPLAWPDNPAPDDAPVPGKFETFASMSDADLRRYIEGCHIAREFGIDFAHAAQELNDRKERGTWSNPGAPVATHSAPHPVPADTAPDDDTTPAPLDGLDVIETADAETLAEFDRLSRAPGVAPPATDARPIPSGPVLRIPAGDLRARIPARFAPAYLLTA